MPPGLSKSRIISHRQCPKRLWLQVKRPDLLDDSATQSVLSVGNTVGTLARAMIPDGVLIDAADLREALRQTTSALAAKPRRVLFEATAQHDGVLVRADVLSPLQRGWHMIEVKSSSKLKDYHVEDAAIQSWVLRQAGVPLAAESIAVVDTAYVYPGQGRYAGLLRQEEITRDVAERRGEVPQWIAAARKTLTATKAPRIDPGPQCNSPFACPFQAHCIPPAEGYPVDILPYGGKLATALKAEGYADLRDVPKSRLSNPRHLQVWQASRSGKAVVDPILPQTLRALGYPRTYMDFESLNPAIPIWPGTRPYQQVVFQWSCHIQTRGGRVTHREFLSDGPQDPRHAFLTTLLDAVGRSGPVLVWNDAFEKTRLRELATIFPAFAPRIDALINRLVDLLPLFRKHYYHPAMMGSTSLKDVLPTIAPDLAYDDLEVANGTMAQEAFQRILLQRIPQSQRESTRQALLQYCERDTGALVRVVREFEAKN
ncbi:MAG: DUF2779 domain-containing protein [Burkholderiales bacterium]|nr:DUF2779 domain-containing protein [Burkholderiales bacterium]